MVKQLETILLDAMKQVATRNIVPAVNKSLQLGETYAKIVSPVDTWDYVKSFEIVPATIQWNFVVWALKNNDDKATWVERWWRKTPSNWSKQTGSPVVEYWVGARVFQKTQEFMKGNFSKNISKW